MKVVAVETVVVGTPWRELTFVELVTDEGLRGVGEARMVNKTDSLVACIGELARRYVVGMDPFDTERLAWQFQWAEYGRAGEITQTALAAIDLACRALEPWSPAWIEEPVPPYNPAGLRQVRAGTWLPVATGERLHVLADSSNGEALRVEHVAKRFGGVTALADVNLRLAKGEVLGLIGDNGAGKSTLIKILCGFHQPDAGKVFVAGEEVVLRSVDHARTLGIDTVYQDLALVNELSVYHNMFLNRELVRWPLLSNRRMRRLAQQHLEDMGVNIPSVDDEVAKLSGGQRQAIAVARSVYSEARTLLLDEPLAAMGAKKGALILDLVRDLKAKGDVSVIIIAHNYGQILEVCDRINLLQHGSITFDRPTSQTSVQELTDLVVAEYRAARTRRLRPDPASDTPAPRP
jgi:ABC-type multidrug transport system ATPase subunit